MTQVHYAFSSEPYVLKFDRQKLISCMIIHMYGMICSPGHNISQVTECCCYCHALLSLTTTFFCCSLLSLQLFISGSNSSSVRFSFGFLILLQHTDNKAKREIACEFRVVQSLLTCLNNHLTEGSRVVSL